MTPQKILSEVRCQIQYQYRIKLEMSIMVIKQRNVVLGAYEMHYFKLTAVRNIYIPHFSLPFGIQATLFNNFSTEVRDTYEPSTPEFPF